MKILQVPVIPIEPITLPITLPINSEREEPVNLINIVEPDLELIE